MTKHGRDSSLVFVINGKRTGLVQKSEATGIPDAMRARVTKAMDQERARMAQEREPLPPVEIAPPIDESEIDLSIPAFLRRTRES